MARFLRALLLGTPVFAAGNPAGEGHCTDDKAPAVAAAAGLALLQRRRGVVETTSGHVAEDLDFPMASVVAPGAGGLAAEPGGTADAQFEAFGLRNASNASKASKASGASNTSNALNASNASNASNTSNTSGPAAAENETGSAHGGMCVNAAFCTDLYDPIWERFCAHYKQVLELDVFQHGRSTCCGSIPGPCRERFVTCAEEAEACLTPSCEQVDWYLGNIESSALQAFTIFGQDVHCFRSCGFNTTRVACAANDTAPDFGYSETGHAALHAFETLNQADLYATAWEVAKNLQESTSDGDDDSGDEGALLLEQAMLARHRAHAGRRHGHGRGKATLDGVARRKARH